MSKEIIRATFINFQRHRDSIIEPAPAGHLTAITGLSGAGKTSALRGLGWDYYNQPDGDDFINVKADSALVGLTIASENGECAVIRERSRGGINRYRIADNGVERKPFEGFGRGNVPLEVQEVTGMHTIKIGDLELKLNLSEQLDGPFLGTKVTSALARAKVLGKLAGTEEVDVAIRQVVSDIRDRKINAKKLETDIKRLGKEIAEYDWLPAAAEKIAQLEGITAAVRAAQTRRELLTGLQCGLEKIVAAIQVQEGILRRWMGLNEADRRIGVAKEGQNWAALFRDRATRLRNTKVAINEDEAIIERWSGLDAARDTLAATQATDVQVRALRREMTRLGVAKTWIADTGKIIARWSALESAGQVVGQVSKDADRRERLTGLGGEVQVLAEGIALWKTVQDRWVSLERVRLEAQILEAAKARLDLMNRLSLNYDRAYAQIVAQEDVLKDLAGLDIAVKMTIDATDMTSSSGRFLDLYNRLAQASTAVRVEQGRVSRLEKVAKAEGRLVTAKTGGDQRQGLATLATKLERIDQEIRHTEGAALIAENRVAELEGAYRDQLSVAGICPICGTDMTEINTQNLRRAI